MDSDWIKTAIEEYKTLREESLSSLTRQLQILSIGTATIGVILLAAVNGWNKTPLIKIFFLYVIPSFLILVFTMWIGEVLRMRRAGIYLRGLETKINNKFHEMWRGNQMAWENPLMWENWLNLRIERRFYYLVYFAILLIFLVMAIGSIYIGIQL